MEAARVSARFQILSQLGRGGMGVVYEAFDHERGERVALKTLTAVEPLQLVQLKNEFRRLRELHHPNLARVHELVSDGDRWYLSMEVVDGVDLRAYVSDAPPIVRETGTSTAWRITSPAPSTPTPALAPPVVDAVRLRHALHGLAAALGELHRAGLVHLDVKPSNILVTSSGRVVLFDFGLTSEAGADPALRPRSIAGTPAYMAPERLSGTTATPAADWYSVGALAYEAMTGSCPRHDHLPVRPSSQVPDLPVDLDELCVRLLDPDPARRPQAAEVQALLGAGRERPARPPSAETFVGRAAELAEIALACAQAERGGIIPVLVTGDSGIGKTTLVRAAVARSGALVLTGRCYERESVPFRGLDAVVDGLGRHLAWLPAADVDDVLPPGCEPLVRLFPSLRRVESLARLALPDSTAPPAELRVAALRALRELIVRLGRNGVVLIHLDDLQWADADTRAALPILLAPDARARLLFLATARDTIPWIPGEVRRLVLGPLPRQDAVSLARSLAPAIDAERIATATDGHPLFVTEMARRVDRAGPGLPTLEDVFRARVGELPELERELCELVAVAGVPVSVRALATTCAAPVLWNALEALLHARLLRASHDDVDPDAWSQVELYHDRLRVALLDALAEPLRQSRHARLAAALERSGGDAELCARSWQGAGDPARAAPYFAIAGHRAADALAFERAADLFGRALAGGLGKTDALLVHARLGDVLAASGATAQALEHYALAGDGAAPADCVRLWRKRAELEQGRGRSDEATRLLGRALDDARRLGLPVEQGRAVEALARMALFRADYAACDRRAGELLELARASASADLAAQARLLAANVSISRGKPHEGRAHLEAFGDELAACSDDIRARFLSVMGRVLIHVDDYAGAADHLERGFSAMMRCGATRGASSALTNLAGVHFLRGDWARACDSWRRCIAWCEHYDNVQEQASLWNNLGVAATLQGDEPAATALLERARELAAGTGRRHLVGRVLGNLADVALQGGRLDEAEARLGECESIFAELAADHDLVETARRRAELALARGQLEDALGAAEAAAARAERAGMRLETVASARVRASALRRLGRADEARAQLEGARRTAETLGLAYEQARVLLDLAELSVEEAAPTPEPARRAAELFDRMECPALSARARAVLRFRA